MNKFHSNKRAFSLVELLVVIAIIGVLAAVVAPSTVSLLTTNKIEHGGELLAQAIGQAKLEASSQAKRVMLAIYESEETATPGNSADPIYNRFALYKLLDDGSSVPFGKVVELPENIIISDNNSISALPALTPFQTTTAQGNIPAGTSGYSMIFKPNGSIALPLVNSNDSNGIWYLAILSSRDAGGNSSTDEDAEDNALPDDYVLVQFDPASSSVTTKRPEVK